MSGRATGPTRVVSGRSIQVLPNRYGIAWCIWYMDLDTLLNSLTHAYLLVHHPSSQLKFKDEDDGTFWMEYKDFRDVYTRINVCDRDTAWDHSLNVREDSGSCGICTGLCLGCMKYWCLCHGLRNLYCSHQSTDQTLDTKEKCCWIC